MELSVSRADEAGCPVVSVDGDVDLYSAPALREQLTSLLDGGEVNIVVDLSEVAFLDSTGIGALVAARAAADERGGSLPLVCTRERILKLFTITGLDGVLDIHDSVNAALGSIKS
jgi:anti-sigma B factor antagonist